jgi:signal transduction histidine kinase
MRWLLPAAIALLAAIYQISLARFVRENHGDMVHYGLEILLYAVVYPIVFWFLLGIVSMWVKQKEQAEAEVYRLNIDLQQLVEQRTAELEAKAEALTEANRRLQELDRLKSEFVSLVSHELRAPLTNVRGAIELMEKSCSAPDATCSKMFSLVSDQTSRLSRVIDDVLNVSRIESGELHLSLTAVDIAQLADRVIDDISTRQTGHIFRQFKRKNLPMVWADADRLYEVIANLLDNAAKYSPAQSEIVLEVETIDRAGVVSVRDTGPGIPREEQDKIFEKFYRLDQGDARETYGYGLGLFLCRQLVEAMNGRIWVDSEEGQGATFRFSLPLAKDNS